MELSSQVSDIISKVKHLQRQSDESSGCGKISLSKDYEVILFQDDDLINVDEMDFSNNETWLHAPTIKSEKTDLTKWLNETVQRTSHPEISDKKIVDTRTYKRPNKRFLRPSIEKFNEQYSEAVKSDDTYEIPNPSGAITSNIVDVTQPLFFDVTQPASCTIFDDIIMSSSMNMDCFQNMSPPSLINSMCSSTFTNLMENSYIKSEALRGRDADYINEILNHQDGDFMHKSVTESSSSLNSDCAENYLRRTLPLLNTTVTKDFNSDSESSSKNETMILKENDNTFCNSNNLNASHIEGNLNGTFKKNITKELSCDMSSSSNSDIQNNLDVPNGIKKDFEEEDVRNHILECNLRKDAPNSNTKEIYSTKNGSSNAKDSTFDRNHTENIDPNTTFNLPPTSTMTKLKSSETFRAPTNMYGTYKKPTITARVNDVTTCLNETISLDDPLDKVKDRSYIIKRNEEERDELVDPMVQIKRFSGSFVTGSTDSLEQGSSRSNSSGGSNRILNMADVDAIVEFQERSLPVMSTPKVSNSMTKLFHERLSPILRQKEHVSDSDLSSTEDYLTSRSTLSKSSDNSEKGNLKSPKRPVKSMHNLKQINEPKFDVQNRWANIPRPTAARGLRGSTSNLRMPEPASYSTKSNLTKMRPVLKGSYTNLRPVSQNLPVVTSEPLNPNVTQTINLNNHQVFQVPYPVTRQSSAPVNIEKPQARGSCLPRPVTGIPRPTSKIPGPRVNRPQIQRGGSQPASKVNLNQGHH